MACACRVNQNIAALQRAFGVKTTGSRESDIRGMVRMLPRKMLILLIVVLSTPFMFLILVFHILFMGNKPINIGKVFRIGNGRNK